MAVLNGPNESCDLARQRLAPQILRSIPRAVRRIAEREGTLCENLPELAGESLYVENVATCLIAAIAPGMIAVSTILIKSAPTSIAIRSAKGSIRILRAQPKPEWSVGLHVTSGNAALLGRFAFRRCGCGRRWGRSIYRRIIGADLGRRCNTCRCHNLRVRTGFACGSTQATVAP
jgi:hypothetical protein